MGVSLKYHAAGTYDFGFIDTSRYHPPIFYTDVDSSQGSWTFSPSGYSIGGGPVVSGSLTGISDTGTTSLILPRSVIAAYYNQVPGSGYDGNSYMFTCSSTFPSSPTVIDGCHATVPGTYINWAAVNKSNMSHVPVSSLPS